MPDLVRAVASLESLPGVADAVAEARDACTRLRWHQALRRRIPQVAGESRVRGAAASAELDGARVPVEVVRDLFRGATAWPSSPDPVQQTVRAAVQVTAESEYAQSMAVLAPAQALARLHVAAGTPLLPPDQVGRPRRRGERVRELVDLGPAPDAGEAGERLQAAIELARRHDAAPALLVAAVIHAEIATARPFVAGNALVARAFERAFLHASGLDPAGVVVWESGRSRGGAAGYVGALTAYATGGRDGVRLWLIESAEAVVNGAHAAEAICDAVLAGRLSGR